MLREKIYETVKKSLTDQFGIESDRIDWEKRLDKDLDFDSLDAVDLIIYLSDYIEGRPEPSMFKGAKTVRDLVDTLNQVWKREG